MITESDIYWITRFDRIRIFSGVIFVVSLLATIALIIAILWISTPPDNNKKGARYLKLYAIPAFLVSIIMPLVLVFLPSTKEMCAIKIIPMVANQEDMKEIPSDIAGLAREWIEELKPNKSTEKK